MPGWLGGGFVEIFPLMVVMNSIFWDDFLYIDVLDGIWQNRGSENTVL
jgi:hypothetical protein